MMSPRRLVLTRAVIAALAWLTVVETGQAQSVARVRQEENVRREPNGEVVGRMEPGATLPIAGRQDRWLQVDMEGWVWARSLQVSDRDGFDLVVSEPQGENLREAPSGSILGRLGRGTLLEEVERATGWIKVRRRVWIWAGSVVETSTGPSRAPSRSGAAQGNPAQTPAAQTPAARSSAAGAEAPLPSARPPGGFAPAGDRGAAVLTAPGGDTLARTVPRAEMEVLARQGDWARVRLEGWTWLPQAAPAAAGAAPETPSVLTPEDLARNPTGLRGRVVSWQLQFISVERAEKVRTDFFEGEPFLLTRYGGGDGPFVYVAVPPERVAEFGGLVPLERLSVTGRVRTGASSLTGTPIIDLVTMERVRNDW